MGRLNWEKAAKRDLLRGPHPNRRASSAQISYINALRDKRHLPPLSKRRTKMLTMQQASVMIETLTG